MKKDREAGRGKRRYLTAFNSRSISKQPLSEDDKYHLL